jgi:protein-S-isoprenylcysteine O-methyltransferase Ste14
VRLTFFLSAFFLLGAAFMVFRIFVRRDYLRHKRLSPLSIALESVIWLPFFLIPYIYNPKSWPAFWVLEPNLPAFLTFFGAILIILGLILGLTAMAWLGFRRAIGQQVDRLIQDGPYRLSRNPQIVGFTPLILGIALRWPSWYAVGWLLLYMAMIHMMVLTEEEHLENLFGEEYEAYSSHVPRYVSFRRRIQ